MYACKIRKENVVVSTVRSEDRRHFYLTPRLLGRKYVCSCCLCVTAFLGQVGDAVGASSTTADSPRIPTHPTIADHRLGAASGTAQARGIVGARGGAIGVKR